MVSAPVALASTIWYSSIINSFRKTGIFTCSLALFKSSFVPPKNSKSVKIDIPDAPASSYCLTTSFTIIELLMMPFEDNNTKVLKCKACGKIISFNKELIKSYNFITIIDHSMIDK